MPIFIGTSTNNQKAISIGNTQLQKVYVGDKLVWQKTNSEPTPINYGALYNWYAAGDIRNITSGTMNVPSQAQWQTLRLHIDPLGGSNFNTNVAGTPLKTTSTTWFDSPNDGTNILNFNAKGSGMRDEYAGDFVEIRKVAGFWTTTSVGSYKWSAELHHNFSGLGTEGWVSPFTRGLSIRLVRTATSEELLLTDGTYVSNYIGNDGTIYTCVKIGTQIWLAENLCETKYQNGDTIPYITNSITWITLATSGMCYYNNNVSNGK